MAENNNSYQAITNTLEYAVSLLPKTAFPLDARSMFGSYDDAAKAAKTAEMAGSTNTKYYIGQQLTVVENGIVSTYLIQADKTLKAVGAEIIADDKTITIGESGEIGLKNFNKQYFAYHAGTETTDAYYELVQGWKEGLEPRVVRTADSTGYELAWYEPSSETIEGVSKIVGTIQTTVDSLSETVDTLNGDANTEGSVANAAKKATDEAARATAAEEALDAKIGTNTAAIATLNGDADTEGSVQNIVATAVANIMDNPDETLNSIKELVDWVNEHAADALALSNDVVANKTAVAAISTLLGTALPESTSATTVIDYITEAYTAISTEKARAEAAEAALATRVKSAEDSIAALTAESGEGSINKAISDAIAEVDTGVHEVVAGTTNGHISVDGTDVKVYEIEKAGATTLGGIKSSTSVLVGEDGTATVGEIEISNVNGLSTSIANAAQTAEDNAKQYVDDNKVEVVASADVADAANASDLKAISEKALVDALTWKTTM